MSVKNYQIIKLLNIIVNNLICMIKNIKNVNYIMLLTNKLNIYTIIMKISNN